MRLGLGSYACAWQLGVAGYDYVALLDAPGFVRRAAELGLRLAQIADNVPLESFNEAELHAVRDAARETGVKLELGTRGVSPAHIERMIALCKFFQSNMLRVVVDTVTHQPESQELTKLLQSYVPALRAAGVVLAVENHDRFRVETLVEIMRVVNDEAVGICLDTVNSFGALEGPGVVVDALAPYVVNLHLKEFVVRRASHLMGFEITGAPAGQGQLDIPWLLAAIRAAGRDPNAIIELWPKPETDMAATLRKEREWCAESAAYLRELIPE